jgi:hypothetical protein
MACTGIKVFRNEPVAFFDMEVSINTKLKCPERSCHFFEPSGDGVLIITFFIVRFDATFTGKKNNKEEYNK